MPSNFTWLDYSEEEKRRALEVIDLFRKQGPGAWLRHPFFRRTRNHPGRVHAAHRTAERAAHLANRDDRETRPNSCAVPVPSGADRQRLEAKTARNRGIFRLIPESAPKIPTRHSWYE